MQAADDGEDVQWFRHGAEVSNDAGRSRVAQTARLLYRRLAAGGTWKIRTRLDNRALRRLAACDTADKLSALQPPEHPRQAHQQVSHDPAHRNRQHPRPE